MRHLLVSVLLILLIVPVVAQEPASGPEYETPRESFQKFIDAVLIEEAAEETRTAAFDRYFDFDTWLANKQKTDGRTYSEEQRAGLKADWYKVFRSTEFRRRYADSGVVIQNSRIDGTSAELKIALGEQQFRVLMTASADGAWWRWYDIPVIEKSKDPVTRVNELEKALQDLRLERERLNENEQTLLDEIARLRSDLAERGAGDSPYSTPKSVVETAWQAIADADANALLDCHTSRRVADADVEAVKKRLAQASERLMSWDVLDSTIDTKDVAVAYVRVRVKLQRVGELDDRTFNVRVERVGKNWKIDEEP